MTKEYKTLLLELKPIILGEIQNNAYFTIEPYISNKYEKITESFYNFG